MIRFDQVTKRFGDGTVAVDQLDLVAASGQVTVLVGPSGCGKTTSLRMINRLVEPTSGRIWLDGQDTASLPATAVRRRIGYVIQDAGLFPHRTVADNVATVPMLLGRSRRQARLDALALLEQVGLDPGLGRRYPAQLSGGQQQQRVGVARALAADPPVLLMDEPFSAVDPVVRTQLQDELLRLQAELGKTIVFVTHDLDEAVKLGDRVAVLRTGGRLAQVATPTELLTRPADGRARGNGEARGNGRGQDGITQPDGVVTAGMLQLGGTPAIQGGSLRAALDAALSSPSGRGVNMGVLGYLQDNRSTILGWLAWHAWLSGVPTVLGLVLAIPLGWLARRSPWLYPPIITTAGLLYTIPSLALFVMLPGVLHTRILDPVNVVVALTVYTVALLVRVVADGLAAVPQPVVQAATAMGYRRWQRLVRVELPVAVPVIAAGVRVAAVSNVSLVSVAAIIGVPELGRLFTSGFQLFETDPIVLGIVGCVLLAGAFDAVVVTTARLLTPWRTAIPAIPDGTSGRARGPAPSDRARGPTTTAEGRG